MNSFKNWMGNKSTTFLVIFSTCLMFVYGCYDIYVREI